MVPEEEEEEGLEVIPTNSSRPRHPPPVLCSRGREEERIRALVLPLSSSSD